MHASSSHIRLGHFGNVIFCCYISL